MEFFESQNMPTPLLAVISIISNIVFTVIGGIIILLWKSFDVTKSAAPYYGLIVIFACYLTLLIISYVFIRAAYNRYVHYVELRLYNIKNNNYGT